MENNEFNKRELLNSLKEEAFQSNPINNSKLEEISLELRKIPKNEKHKFYKFVEEYLDTCFILGLVQNSINLEDFMPSEYEKNNNQEVFISNSDFKAKKDDSFILSFDDNLNNEIIEVNKSIISFKTLFEEVKLNLKEYLEIYKGYYVLKLENDATKSFNLIFLYEENYFFELLQKKINNHFENVKFIEIKKFTNEINDHSENYLCVLLLNSKSNNEIGLKTLVKDLSKIIDSYENFNNYSFYKNHKNRTVEFEESNVKSDFIEEIEYVNSTFLSNYDVSFAEEKMIKKLFSITPLVFYKVLTSGFSGAKVLEIRPKVSHDFEKEKKYIIKYDILKSGKLNNEFRNFETYIDCSKGFNEYKGVYKKTLTHEGIRYNYAISDFSQESFSFNDIIKNKENKFYSNRNNLIKKLFEINLFKHWKLEHFVKKENIIKDIYKSFINKNEILNQLSIILNKDIEEIKNDNVIINFNKIWNSNINYYEKICHGDLHTENFFIDDNGVYLIDFGFTGKQHSYIDYAALECSLKFKHLPFYIESNELKEIELELLSDNTFNLNYNFSRTTRKEALELLEIINSIRNHTIVDFPDSLNNLEYYISLFIMTIRQIRYPNMNQLYAYHSANILGEYITKQLGI